MRRFLTLLLLASGTAIAPAALRAQESEPDTAEAALPLPPVEVTVLRSPLELAAVPYAVSVKTAPGIRRARPGLGLDEALRGVPGLQVDNRYNYALGDRISIRGFGARAQFGVRGVRVLVDGIPATLPDGQTALNHVDLGALARVEVIRGPASALYGNAAGGVIQMETASPPRTGLAQEVTAVAGEDGLLRLHSSTGGRSGRATYVLNVSRLTYDGYRAFSAAERLNATARLGYSGAGGEWTLTAHAVEYDASNPGSLSDSLLRADRTQAFANNVRQRTGEEGRQGQVGLTWRGGLGAGELEVAGYALGRSIANPIPPTIIDLERAAAGLRALYRSGVPENGGAFRWSLGLEADAQRDDRSNFANEEGSRGPLALSQEEAVDGLAAFAQAVAAVAPRLDLLGALRYDRFRFRAEDRFLEDGTDDSGSRSLAAVSPSLGLTLAARDALNLYASVSTAFETPTTTELANRPNGAGGFNPELEPQRTVSYELGAKGLLAGAVTFQISAYRADVENALIPFEVPEAAGRQFFRNAGSAVHRGVEAGASWAPRERIVARVAYAYTDARFDEYAVDGEVHDGNRVPGVAPHRLDAGLSYDGAELAALRAGRPFASVEARYSSELPVNDANDAFSAGYTLVDLRAGIDGVRADGLRLAPFIGVRNLFDTRYDTSVVVNAFGGRYHEPGPGRTLHAGARVGVGVN